MLFNIKKGVLILFLFVGVCTKGQQNVDVENINHLLNRANEIRTQFPDSTIFFAESALTIATSIFNDTAIAECYNFIGIGYWSKSDFEKAIQYFLKALTIYQTANNIKGIGVVYNGLALTHWQTGNIDLAKMYHHKALAIKKLSGNAIAISQSMNNLGLIYIETNVLDSAMFYMQQAYNIQQNIENAPIANTVINLGNIFFKQNKLDSALTYFYQARDYALRDNQMQNIIIASINIGTVLLNLEKTTAGIQYFNRALQMSDSLNFIQNLAQSHFGLYKAYEELHMFDSALFHVVLYQGWMDSISNENVKNTINELQTRYETREKDQQIAIQKMRLEQKNRVVTIMSIVVVVLLILISLIIFLYQQRSKTYRVLANKNLAIARTIQTPTIPHTVNETADGDENTDIYIFNKLVKLMNIEKPYRSADLTIEVLANQLGTNRTYLSRAIKNSCNYNYNSYINNLRIQDALLLLADPSYENYTIEAIAQIVGFSSKSTFNKFFKSSTGITPSVYKSEILHTE